jgi:hypothetical protein
MVKFLSSPVTTWWSVFQGAAVILKTFNVESFRVFSKDACGVEDLHF